LCKKAQKPQYQQYCGENLKTDDTSYHENQGKIQVLEVLTVDNQFNKYISQPATIALKRTSIMRSTT
jgi:hypothetical protein